MDNNGPIAVSAPGTSLTGAVGKDITFSTRSPFFKLDSTNKVSFQVLEFLFSSDTTNPDGVTTFTNSVPVYQFAHGYKYPPTTWAELSLDGFQTVSGTEGYFLVGGGDNNTSSAAFVVTADSTNITCSVDKYYLASGMLGVPSVFGLAVSLRLYVAVNDLSGTDVPSQP